MSSPISAAILTVSDTATQDNSADRSGPTIQQILSDRNIVVHEDSYKIVPDDAGAIQSVVKEWLSRTDRRIDWIVTTGGTGFGVRDITPEAIAPLLERQAPGLVHLLISSSLKYTPLAALSRPVAGTSGNTLITTLPGSVKAVKECLEALLNGGVITHAVDLARGGSGKQVHAALGSLHGGEAQREAHGHHHGTHRHHHHEHGHGGHHPPTPHSAAALSHDPNAPASARHRQSPYPIISLDKALKIIDERIERLSAETRTVEPALRGHALAEDVYAPQNVPAMATTSVDGYALRATDPPGVYKVITSTTHRVSDSVPDGTIYRINTGGPLPVGTDTVIMVEDTKLVSTYTDSDGAVPGEEKEVETLAQIPAGENVRNPGSDVRKGDLVMQAGDRILSVGGEVGTLAFVGRKEVTVYRKPVVALLSTGNELVDLQNPRLTQSEESWGGIYDTNRPALQAVLEGLGYQVVDLGIVADTVAEHAKAIQRGLDEADVILTTGGTSMGPTDLLKPVIERNFDGTVHFGRVAIKPGKPTTFATIPTPRKEAPNSGELHKPIFALPGNPASALVTFYVFVLPALRKLGGWPQEVRNLPRVRVQVKSPMYFDPRLEFHRAITKVQPSTGVLEAWSTGGQRSSRVASLSGANGFVIVPPLKAGETKIAFEPGDWAEAILIGELQTL